MTQSERTAYWYKWNAFQQKYERYYTSKFYQALQIQVKAYIATNDVVSIPSFPIYEVLLSLYKTCGPAWARITKVNVNKADGQMGFNEDIVRLMQQYYGIDLLNDAELMTQHSREVIVKVLSDAAINGDSYDQIVGTLLKHPEFSRMRAMRIARTETVTASNGAAIIYANQSGLKLDKTWIAVKDKRTRHDHRNVTTNPIAIEEPFKVGDSYMMQPGVRTQPDGQAVPAKETVNCRCTIGFIPKRDASGRLIRT